MGLYWAELWTPAILKTHYNLKKEQMKDGELLLYLRKIKATSMLDLSCNGVLPVLLLSGNVFGLVDDCLHMEAEPLENCCEERNP